MFKSNSRNQKIEGFGFQKIFRICSSVLTKLMTTGLWVGGSVGKRKVVGGLVGRLLGGWWVGARWI